ncbi:MAG: CRISPR-associated endonuclease Cas2 [Candidatus Anstonellales archaeon]
MEFLDVAVFYDISDDRKRSHFGEFLKDLGLERVQKSGFMGTLRDDRLNKLLDKCKEFSSDTIHVILLYKCKSSSVLCFGKGFYPEDEDYINF